MTWKRDPRGRFLPADGRESVRAWTERQLNDVRREFQCQHIHTRDHVVEQVDRVLRKLPATHTARPDRAMLAGLFFGFVIGVLVGAVL